MSLTWHEGIGWLVEALLVALGLIVVGSTASEGDIRPFLVSALGFGIIIGTWTWVMLRYGK